MKPLLKGNSKDTEEKWKIGNDGQLYCAPQMYSCSLAQEAVWFRVLSKGTQFPRYWVPFPIALVKKPDSQKGTQFPKKTLPW